MRVSVDTRPTATVVPYIAGNFVVANFSMNYS